MITLKNIRGIEAIKNIGNLYNSQLFSMLFNLLLSLYIPKFIGVEEFSYWQLFLLYSSYTGLLQLGLNDGIYLRFGGKTFTDSESKSVSSQLWIQAGIISILALLSILLTYICPLNSRTVKFLIITVALYAVFYNINGFCISVLQAINKFKVFTRTIILEKLFLTTLLGIMIILTIRDYQYIVISCIIALVFSTSIIIYKNKDIFLRGLNVTKDTFSQMGENIKVGINLMLSNVSSMLIIGICRFCISDHFPIKTFGYVSFSLSICSFILIFISKIGVGIYPILKNKSEEIKALVFFSIDRLLTFLLPLSFVIYPIMGLIIRKFLPHYLPSMGYLASILPLCIYTAKIDMLYSTYLKIFRFERLLLKINISTMSLSSFLSFVGIYVFNNLHITLMMVCCCVILKATYMQIIINKKLNNKEMLFFNINDLGIVIVYYILLISKVSPLIAVYIVLCLSILSIMIRKKQVKQSLCFFINSRSL